MNNNLSECKVLDYMPNCQKQLPFLANYIVARIKMLPWPVQAPVYDWGIVNRKSVAQYDARFCSRACCLELF